MQSVQSVAYDLTVARTPVERAVVQPGTTTSLDWRAGLPVLDASRARLRELRRTDAPALMSLLGVPAVSRFLTPPPKSVDGLSRFIDWSHAGRAMGQVACFGVTPRSSDRLAGLFQVRAIDDHLLTAEWGFFLAPALWGSGLFLESARLVLTFVFDVVGVQRLEACSLACNDRGSGALRKVGAVPERILPRSFLYQDRYEDEILWSIRAETWRQLPVVRIPMVH